MKPYLHYCIGFVQLTENLTSLVCVVARLPSTVFKGLDCSNSCNIAVMGFWINFLNYSSTSNLYVHEAFTMWRKQNTTRLKYFFQSIPFSLIQKSRVREILNLLTLHFFSFGGKGEGTTFYIYNILYI